MPSTTRRPRGSWPASPTSAPRRASGSRSSRSPAPPRTSSASPRRWWTGSWCGPPATTTRCSTRSRIAGCRPRYTPGRAGRAARGRHRRPRGGRGDRRGGVPRRRPGPLVLSFPLDRRRARRCSPGRRPAGALPGHPHRWEGFRDAWRETGHPVGDLRLAVCPVNTAADGEAFVAELLAGDDPPDAIAAMSDELALGALRAAPATGCGSRRGRGHRLGRHRGGGPPA